MDEEEEEVLDAIEEHAVEELDPPGSHSPLVPMIEAGVVSESGSEEEEAARERLDSLIHSQPHVSLSAGQSGDSDLRNARPLTTRALSKAFSNQIPAHSCNVMAKQNVTSVAANYPLLLNAAVSRLCGLITL